MGKIVVFVALFSVLYVAANVTLDAVERQIREEALEW
jgi:hypothetical protein